MSQPGDLSDLQLRILTILWERRTASVAQLYDALREEMPISRKTVATLLSRLEERRMVAHSLVGRENVYHATVSRRRVLIARLRNVLAPLFPAHAQSLGVHGVDGGELRPGDTKRLVRLLQDAQRDLEKGG